MTARVLAIGWDAGDSAMIEKLLAQGKLPHLRRLRDQGAWADIDSSPFYLDESAWTVFLSGRSQSATGFWTSLRLRRGTYEVCDRGSYDFQHIPHFFQYAHERKIAIFDLPHSNTLWKQIDGIHVIGWGAHFLPTFGGSVPSDLYGRVVKEFGRYPASDLQYMGINWWDGQFLKTMEQALLEGITTRVKICKDLLQREQWDFFLTVFPEAHNGSHHLEHLNNPNHPLWPGHASGTEKDPMIAIYEALDSAVGELIGSLPEDAHVAVFSIQGHGMNSNDLPGLVFVPEFLFRLNFPDKNLFPRGNPGSDCPPILRQLTKRTWPGDMWDRRSDSWLTRKVLCPFTDKVVYPGSIDAQSGTLSSALDLPGRIIEGLRRRFAHKACDFSPVQLAWNPALWYQRWWPKMRAFALPSYADGYVRISVKGREPHGLVDPKDYDRECDRIADELRLLTDARSGKPLVADIWKPRVSALEEDPLLPDADLVAVFDEQPTDVVESHSCGRIGPFPYLRTGGPRSQGFFAVRGPGIQGPSSLGTVRIVDIPPTLLGLMGVQADEKLEGTRLVSPT